jgi:hypothetical protein
MRGLPRHPTTHGTVMAGDVLVLASDEKAAVHFERK